jgi:NDP-sugar pyrophosphorylase family protein
MQYLIPAAGRGSRFSSAGFEEPKPLIKLHGIPLIVWVLANFNYKKNDSISIVVQKDSFDISYLGKYLKSLPIKPNFILLDEITDGAARTVFFATKVLDPEKPMIVANSDQYVTKDLQNYVDYASSTKADGCILTMKASSNKWSYVSVDSDNHIRQVVEKKEISSEATVGVYSWRKVGLFTNSFRNMVSAKDRVNGEFYLAPTYNYMIGNGQVVSYLNVGEIDVNVHGLGTPEDFAKFESNPLSLKHATKIKEKLSLNFKNF